MRRHRRLWATAVAVMVPASAPAQYPGYPGLPGIGRYSGAVGGLGGYGYGYGYGGMGYGSGGYMGYPITPFGGGIFGNSGPFAPNYYNRANQPLSPYLNLLRGGNSAVNYFYGVRPGTPAGQPLGGGMGAPTVGFTQLRTGYLPLAGSASDEPVELPVAGQPTKFPPSAHPVVFGNRFGPNTGRGAGTGRPSFFGQQGQQGQQQGMGRPQTQPGGTGRTGVPPPSR